MHFGTSQLPKSEPAVFLDCCLDMWVALHWHSNSCLISPDGSATAALASLLFDPPELQPIGKAECFAIFPCVFSVHVVGSLTSKLLSMRRTRPDWVCQGSSLAKSSSSVKCDHSLCFNITGIYLFLFWWIGGGVMFSVGL